MRTGILAASTLLLAMHAVAGAAEPPPGQPQFRRHCGPCHLQGGTGTFMLGRRLGTQNALLEGRAGLAPDYIRGVVRNGIFSMPRFSRAELPDADLARIAQYLAAATPPTP